VLAAVTEYHPGVPLVIGADFDREDEQHRPGLLGRDRPQAAALAGLGQADEHDAERDASDHAVTQG
jgi:hypothetical protein